MTKEESLLKEIAELNNEISSAKENWNELNQQLNIKVDELEEVNLPVVTVSQSNAIRGAIAEVINNFNFDEPEDYEYDFSIGYDNRIDVESIMPRNLDELERQLCDGLGELFKVVENKTQENEN